jgi:hypothetical protein
MNPVVAVAAASTLLSKPNSDQAEPLALSHDRITRDKIRQCP